MRPVVVKTTNLEAKTRMDTWLWFRYFLIYKDRQFVCLYRRSRKIQLTNCKSVEALGFPLRSVRNGRLQFFCYIGVVLYFR